MSHGLWRALDEDAGRGGVEAAVARPVLTAFELLTAGEDAWPHVAWLGPAEVLAVEHKSIALALWPQSTTRRNLDSSGRAVLQLVAAGTVYKVRLSVEPLGAIAVGESQLAGFLGSVIDVVEDSVKYAEVLTGLTYRLQNSGIVLDRWRSQIDGLVEAVARREPPGEERRQR